MIVYDLRGKVPDYQGLMKEMSSFFPGCMHSGSSWVITAACTVMELYQRLLPHLLDGDDIRILEV
jgi:hypothetical protein